MATTNTENYTRINLMLVNGGTLLTKQLFLKRITELSVSGTELTVDEFLEKNKQQILATKTGRSKKHLIFPANGHADLNKWDLYLFCFMLLTICDLHSTTKIDVEQLQTMRNKLCHLSEPNLTPDDFKDRLDKLKVIFQRTLPLINDTDLERTVNNLVESYENGPISLNDIVNLNHKLSQSELQSGEMISKMDTALEKQDRIMADLQSALTRLDDIFRNLPKNTEVDVPGIQVSMEVKNCNKDSEKELLDYLEMEFNKTISNPEYTLIDIIPNHAMHKITQAVVKTFQSFLSNGRYLVKVQQKCLLFTIKCKDIPTFINLVQDCIDGKFLNQLDDLRNAVILWPGCEKLEFETHILPENVVQAICELASSLCKYTVDRSLSVQQNQGIMDGDGQSNNGLKLTIHPNTVEGFNEIETALSSEEHSRGLNEIHQEMRKMPDLHNAVVSFRVSDTLKSEHSTNSTPKECLLAEMRSSSGPTSTTAVSREIPNDSQTLGGSHQIVSDKPLSAVTDKFEKVDVTGRTVPNTSHAVSTYLYKKEEKGDADKPYLPLIEIISEAITKESPYRTLNQDGLQLYPCLAKCMQNIGTMQEFENYVYIQKAVDGFLNGHSDALQSIIPLLVYNDDEYALGIRSFKHHRMSLTSLNVQKEYAKCCLYLAATCMNTHIYMMSTDQRCMHHWEYFKPLFEYKGQPKRNEKYITMYMSPDNTFYMIESAKHPAAAPKATGRIEIYKDALENYPHENQDCHNLLSQLEQVLCEKNKCVGKLVNQCHSYGVNVHGKTYKVLEPVFSRGFFVIMAGIVLELLASVVSHFVPPVLVDVANGLWKFFSKDENRKIAITSEGIKKEMLEVNQVEAKLFRIIERLEEKCELRSTAVVIPLRRYSDPLALRSVERLVNSAFEQKPSFSIVYDVALFEQTIETIPDDHLSKERIGNQLAIMLKVVVAKDTILNTMLRGNLISSNDYYF